MLLFSFGVLAIAAGIGGFVYFLFNGIYGLGDELIRIEVPAAEPVELPRSGNYTVFWEYQTIRDGAVIYSESLPDSLTFQIRAPDGEWMDVAPASSNSTYDLGRRRGVSILQFSVNSPGMYVVSAGYSGSRSGAPVILTMVQGFMWRIVRILVLSGSFLLGGLVAGALVIVFTLLHFRTAAE